MTTRRNPMNETQEMRDGQLAGKIARMMFVNHPAHIAIMRAIMEGGCRGPDRPCPAERRLRFLLPKPEPAKPKRCRRRRVAKAADLEDCTFGEFLGEKKTS